MNKHFRIGKRILALCMTVFMVSGTYATATSNDGTSFVTKAEFDSLVNNFNDEMAKYQSGLNAKIDDAISGYLAGLSQESRVAQSSLINQANYRFTNSWSLYKGGNKSQLGNKFVYNFLMVVMTTGQWDGRNTILWQLGAGASDYCKFVTVGSDNSKYVVYEKSKWDDRYKVIVSLMESYPISSATYIYHSLWFNYSNPVWPSTLDTSVVTYTGDSWGNVPVSKFGQIYGKNIDAKGVGSFSSNDTMTIPEDSNLVSGNSVPTGDIIYAVDNEEMNKKMTTHRSNITGNCRIAYCWARKYDGTLEVQCDSSNQPEQAAAFSGQYKIAGYDHKYTEIPASTGYKDFILESVSMLVNEPVKYFSGLPLFTATENGTVELELEFQNTDSADSTWQIQEGIFDVNGAITAGLGSLSNGSTEYIDDAGNVIRNRYVVPAGKVQTIKFDVNRGRTYWIKINPASGLSKVTSKKIDIVK